MRQAISHAIDRDAILQSFGNGYGTVTQQVFAPGSAGYDESLDELYPYDVDEAKELMASSGVEPLTMTMPASFAFFGGAVYAVIADSSAEIGITGEYEEPVAGELITDLPIPKYPAYFMHLEQSPNDWNAIRFLVAPDAIWNPGGCTDDVVPGLLEEIQFAAEDEERGAKIADLGTHIAEEAWYVPFYRNDNIYVTDTSIDVEIQTGNAVPYLWSFTPQG